MTRGHLFESDLFESRQAEKLAALLLETWPELEAEVVQASKFYSEMPTGGRNRHLMDSLEWTAVWSALNV